MKFLKKVGDLAYTIRFLKLLTTPFDQTEAFKRNIIDANGKRLKSFRLNTFQNRDDYKNYYTPFIRLVFNLKRLMAKVPGGQSKLASYASALYLIKENYNVSDAKLMDALEAGGYSIEMLQEEHSTWFILEDKQLSPGVYRLREDKVLNETYDDIVRGKDRVRVLDNSFPVGQMLGLDIYEVVHQKTNKKVFIAIGELLS